MGTRHIFALIRWRGETKDISTQQYKATYNNNNNKFGWQPLASVVLNDEKSEIGGGHFHFVLVEEHVENLFGSCLRGDPNAAPGCIRRRERTRLAQVEMSVDRTPTLELIYQDH